MTAVPQSPLTDRARAIMEGVYRRQQASLSGRHSEVVDNSRSPEDERPERLRELRLQAGLTQRKLADALGTSDGAISWAEHTGSHPGTRRRAILYLEDLLAE